MKFLKLTKKLTEYIVFPLAFFISITLFLYLVLSPFLSLALDAWEMFSFDANQTFGEEIHKDIFGEGKMEGYSGTIPASKITYPTVGTKYGEITITANDTVNIIPLYFGDTNSILRKGAGHYMGSRFPGEGSTILISAHNNRHFNCLQYVKVGDEIKVETNYGTYIYEVEHAAPNHDGNPFGFASKTEKLVLYTCYPFDELGLTPHRYFVVSKLISGPVILQYE